MTNPKSKTTIDPELPAKLKAGAAENEKTGDESLDQLVKDAIKIHLERKSHNHRRGESQSVPVFVGSSEPYHEKQLPARLRPYSQMQGYVIEEGRGNVLYRRPEEYARLMNAWRQLTRAGVRDKVDPKRLRDYLEARDLAKGLNENGKALIRSLYGINHRLPL